VIGAVSDNQGSHNKMADVFFDDTSRRIDLVERIGALVHAYAATTAPT